MKWWRKPFFFTLSGMADPDPLPVNWPAGDAVFTVDLFVAVTMWTHDQRVINLSTPTTLKLAGNFSSPVHCFHWSAAPEHGRITSVKIGGEEQLRQLTTPEDAKTPGKFGIPAAMFWPRPYSIEVPRRWWAWLPRLLAPVLAPLAAGFLVASWGRKEDEDDD